MTRRTLSEIRATCTKAARGAGCPWGLAEEAGMIAQSLEARGAPGAATVANLLTTPRACNCDGTGEAKCGLALSASLSDAPPKETTTYEGPIAGPLLLAVPFLDAPNIIWRIDWGNGAAICTDGGIALTGSPAPEIAENVIISLAASKQDPAHPSLQSRDVPDDIWTMLETQAAKTYVPETNQSRNAGAGPDDAQDE